MSQITMATNVRAITVKMLIEIQAIYKPLQFLELQTQEVRKEDSQFADSSASFDHTEKSHSQKFDAFH